MLKESGEFDALLPDLLLAMDIAPISKPQKGVRQAGVDLAAAGKDDSGSRTLWLFVLKRGDLSRRDWDCGPQAVRQSLEEINDVYLHNNVAPEHQDLPVRIVIATTGDFKQDFEQQRVGYFNNNTQPGMTYETWNGDYVATKMEEHLLNEYALPPAARSELRKSLALVGEPDYELVHFYNLLRILLKWENDAKQTEHECLRDLRTVSLALEILCRWAEQDGNLKNAVIACERTLLWTWDALRRHDLMQNPGMIRGYSRIIELYLTATAEYFNKVQSHLHHQDAYVRYHREPALVAERVFEEVGLLSTFGLVYYLFGKGTKNEQYVTGAQAVATSLEAFLQTHTALNSPCYDGQSIDIGLALVFLLLVDHPNAVKAWLRELTARLLFGFRSQKWFPISTDSFDDLADLHLGNADVSKLRATSWMVPLLGEWMAALEDEEGYSQLVTLNEVLRETTFQVWYPDEKTAEALYVGSAVDTGISEAPIVLPPTTKDMRDRIRTICTDSPARHKYITSAQKVGIGWLDFIANRHFRTPLNPVLWHKLVTDID
jgi:hypothetical protein